MKILTGRDVQNFERTGRILLNEPPRLDLVEQIIPDFIRLTKEPLAYRKLWEFDISENDDPDDGLIQRNGKKGKDVKFYFHYRPHLRAMLILRGVDTSGYEDFLINCDRLYEACAKNTGKILRDLDANMIPSYNLVSRLHRREMMKRYFLRLLYYPAVRKIVAGKHPDQSFLTTHVAESHKGLMLGDDKAPYKASLDSQMCFTGMRAEIITKGKIKAVRHFVKAFSKESRWSVVFFNHLYCDIDDRKIIKMIRKEKATY